ncbi:AraC family transcriptional regulator [Clostridium sp. OS1-26]|uniref:helix-turn-helix domain-containing protein n=1 Tax=Clostridium sp. OS1-26 TaxID=3070681 RepID=UPI0027DFA278|nr:AraC family transcriptional regulator [Clostridium sp. OS1-26]WML32869.1 AraC family transcriptional regulator [Clostridium sp. OS1-26]
MFLLTEKYIKNAIDKFYSCALIPIKALKADGTLIHSAGLDAQLDKAFNSDEIYKEIKNNILQNEERYPMTTTCLDNIKFTASPICPCKPMESLFVIGPYVSEPLEESNIVYKPESCIPHIMSLLHSIYKDEALIDKKSNENSEIYTYYVKKAIDYINKNYHKSITLDDISKELNINKCYFCSLFRGETGKTYSQYLNELRIEKSKELIAAENLPLLHIALSVGFNNQNYFSMIFKKFTNMTPLEFRNSIEFKG